MSLALRRLLGLPILALALGATGYGAWTYSGLYRWIAEAQLSAFGSYEVRLTFALTFIVYCAPAVALIFVVARVMGGSGMAHADDRTGVNEWIQANRGSLFLGILAIGFFGTSAFFAFDAVQIGDLVSMDVGEIEAGAQPRSRYVKLRGTLRRWGSRSLTEGRIEKSYIPIVARSGRPAVYLEAHALALTRYSNELESSEYEGVLYEDGLPGLIREDLARRGMLPSRHYVLAWRETPANRWSLVATFAAAGGIALVILALIVVATRIRRTGSAVA